MAGTTDTTTGRGRRLFDGALLLIAIGAVALAVSLFLDWYGGDDGFDDAASAWTAFELIDMLLLALALTALVAVGERLIAPHRTPGLPEWVGAVAGPVALVIVFVSIVDKPPVPSAVGASLEEGGWIALAGAALMTIGALLGRLRISIVVGARERSAAVDREAETRPLRTEADAPADPDRPFGAP